MALQAVHSGFQQTQIVSPSAVQMKHRLLFLEIRIGSFLQECLKKTEPVDDRDLQEAVTLYKQAEQAMFTNSCFELDRLLHEMLVNLYEMRVHLSERLQSVLHSNRLKTFGDLLYELDRLICILNSGKDLESDRVEEWGKTVDQFQSTVLPSLEKKRFKLCWGPLYHKIIRKAEILSLYLTWEQVIKKKREALLSPKLNQYYVAIQIKWLLQADKKVLFRSYFLSHGGRPYALQLCSEIFHKEPSAMLATLLTQIEKARSRIRGYEKHLLSKIGRFQNVVATLACFVMDNPFMRTASALVEGQENITRTWKKIPLLSTPLEAPFLTLTKGIGGCGLFTIHVIQLKRVGVTQTLLQWCAQPFTVSPDGWITCFRLFGLDEKATMSALPYIDTFFECTSFVLFTGYTVGFEASVLLHAGISYFAALSIVNELSESVTRHPLFRALTQMTVFPYVSTAVFSFLQERQSVYFGPIFENREACMANQELCKQEACTALGLSERASAQEIKKVFRELAKAYHPDHHPEGTARYTQLTAAKSVCLKYT